jgi:GT2 family glycosyltransferase
MRVDTLMITYNRPRYTALSLPRLLETCDEHCRVWVWHNGDDAATLDVVRAHEDHPRFHRLHHSPENLKLREPTNWFWSHADGALLGKVDDDCLMPDGWIQTLRRAHADVPEFGVIGCWLFREEDVVPELAKRKIRAFPGGHQLMVNCWLGGSGYLMKRACYDQLGPLRAKQGFTTYCLQLARRGWTHGWYYPLLYMDHMDDPRSPHTVFKTEADYQQHRGLTAANRGIDTLAQFQARQAEAALELQQATPDIRYHVGWRAWLRRARHRLGRISRVRPSA